jgi:hypothetical protein
MFLTNKSIRYCAAPYGLIAEIPQATECIPATNLPLDKNGNQQFWAQPWDGMVQQEESWHRNYGFLLSFEDVEECVCSYCQSPEECVCNPDDY